jgi:hypothetical protein
MLGKMDSRRGSLKSRAVAVRNRNAALPLASAMLKKMGNGAGVGDGCRLQREGRAGDVKPPKPIWER